MASDLVTYFQDLVSSLVGLFSCFNKNRLNKNIDNTLQVCVPSKYLGTPLRIILKISVHRNKDTRGSNLCREFKIDKKNVKFRLSTQDQSRYMQLSGKLLFFAGSCMLWDFGCLISCVTDPNFSNIEPCIFTTKFILEMWQQFKDMTAPSHHPNQCRLLIIGILWRSP